MSQKVPESEEVKGRPASLAAGILTRGIAAGKFRAGDYLPPLRELSRLHGLSTETFRRALKVLEKKRMVISEPRQGFRVAQGACAWDRGSDETGTVLFVGPPGGESEWTEMHRTMLIELQHLAARENFALLSVSSAQAPTRALQERILGSRATGAILERRNPAYEEMLRRAGLATVLVESAEGAADMDVVVQDGARAVRQAIAYLAGRGHRRIGWIGPDARGADAHIIDRFSGYAGGMAEIGRTLDEDDMIFIPYRDPGAARAIIGEALRSKRAPNAFVVPWRHATEAALEALFDAGLVAGRDIDLVGWSTDEAYGFGFIRNTSGIQAPPAMVWSVRAMVELAYARLEQRLAQPGLPFTETRVPMRIRFPEDMTEERK